MANKILQHGLRQADYTRNIWSIVPEAGTSLEDVLAPEFWANVSKSLKKGDHIDVVPDSGEYYAELFVVAAGDKFAKVVVLRRVDFTQPGIKSDASEFEAKHRGGAGWSVIRKSDKSVMFEKAATKAEAEAWIAEHNELV